MGYDGRRLNKLRKGYEKAAEFYNLFASNEDIPFYSRYAKQQGSPILDLAAGAGRVSIELAKTGQRVVAIEQSLPMIREFRKNLGQIDRKISERVTLIEGDMTRTVLDQQFPLIIIPASFGHAITTEEQISLLRNVNKMLRPDGVFILDLFPGGFQPEYSTFSEPPIELPDGKTVTRSGVMNADPVTQILELELKFTVRNQSGEIVDEVMQISGAALVYNREANLLLRLSGLSIVEEYGDFDFSPYTRKSARRILIVKKEKP